MEDNDLKDWLSMKVEERKFSISARDSNGNKHGVAFIYLHDYEKDYDPEKEECYMQPSYALWKKPEELGFVECVGSYKWKATKKLNELISSRLCIDDN